jgi:hypothetical protein
MVKAQIRVQWEVGELNDGQRNGALVRFRISIFVLVFQQLMDKEIAPVLFRFLEITFGAETLLVLSDFLGHQSWNFLQHQDPNWDLFSRRTATLVRLGLSFSKS